MHVFWRGRPACKTLIPYPPSVTTPLAARAALAQLAGWCKQFSPTVGLEYVGLEYVGWEDARWKDAGLENSSPESLFLNVTGLTPLFGGEAVLVERVARAFAQRGFTARLALADSIGAAWAVARYGGIADGGLRISDWGLKTPLPPGEQAGGVSVRAGRRSNAVGCGFGGGRSR